MTVHQLDALAVLLVVGALVVCGLWIERRRT